MTMQQLDKPIHIIEAHFQDKRGSVRFTNDFRFEGVKCFYQVTQDISEPIRAFHAHLHESKHEYVTKGENFLILAEVNTLPKPAKKVQLHSFILSSQTPSIVFIPPRIANGFKVLEPDSEVIFYSDKSVAESESDDYRLAFDYWGTKIWNNV